MNLKLIKLYQPACVPCQQVDNYLQENGVVYESFNVQDSPEVAAKFGVMGIPVTILLDDNDDEVSRSVGFRPMELEVLISKL